MHVLEIPQTVLAGQTVQGGGSASGTNVDGGSAASVFPAIGVNGGDANG